MHYVLHLSFGTLGKNENNTFYTVYFKELSNDKAILILFFHLVFYPELFKFPAGNRIHIVCLNEDTLLMELYTEMRVELRELHLGAVSSQKSLPSSGAQGQGRREISDPSDSWSHEGGANLCDLSSERPVATIREVAQKQRGNEKEIS